MKRYGASAFLVLLLLIGWEIGARMVDLPFILPTPTAITVKLWELKSVLLFEHLPSTLPNHPDWFRYFACTRNWTRDLDVSK